MAVFVRSWWTGDYGQRETIYTFGSMADRATFQLEYPVLGVAFVEIKPVEVGTLLDRTEVQTSVVDVRRDFSTGQLREHPSRDWESR